MKKIFHILLITLIFSCSKTKEVENAENSYTKAVKMLKDKDYNAAADAFEKIEGEYPFSKWAQKAQTMAVYARYKAGTYDKLLSTTDDFLHLNPNSEYAPYMLYMKGLTYYDQIPSINRAQDNTKQASIAFRELVARFPETDYAADAKEKIYVVDEHIAGAKMAIGRYEIKNNNYVGAINNFKEVIDRYRQTDQVPEAYFRLSEIYYKIGLTKQAKQTISQLKEKYRDNYWAGLSEKIDAK